MTVRFVLAALALGAMAAPTALAEPFRVLVDQTVLLKLGRPAESVVIGNATVADVTVHDPSTLLVTGKAFGTTNLIVLDNSGRTIYSNTLAVSASNPGQLTIIRGGGAFSYSCIDKCRPTPMVGDSPDHFGQVMSTVTGKAAPAAGR